MIITYVLTCEITGRLITLTVVSWFGKTMTQTASWN